MVSRKVKKRRKKAFADLSQQATNAGLNVDLSGFKKKGQYKAKNKALKAALSELPDDPVDPQVPDEELPPEFTAMDQARQVTNAIGAITPGVAADTAAGLGFRQDIRNLIGPELAALDNEGFTDQDYQDIQAVRDQRMADAQSDFRSRVQGVIGDLKGRGFSSSSLTPKALDSGAIKAYDRNVQGIQAQEAQMRQSILNARAGRRAQRIGSALGAANTLGTGGVSQLQGAYINPNAYGGLTQAGAASILPGIANQGANFWSQQGLSSAQIQTTPRPIAF